MIRDRSGEQLDEQQPERWDGHRCDRGWLDDDAQGRPRPCLKCRPWLADGAVGAADRARAHRRPTA